MKTILPLKEKGNWYKGNLHCHSTISDGRFTPEEVVNMYKNKGYSFLAFSDHEIFTNWNEFNTDEFLIMPAIERAINVGERGMCYHIHGIQGSSEYVKNSKKGPLKHKQETIIPKWEGQETVQEVINELNDTGNLVMLNHPVWSLNELDDFVNLEGYFAMEIFNWNCEMENKTGLATLYWDLLLNRGKKVWGTATDDNHNRNIYDEAPAEFDSFGGWINVNAKELTQDAIADAMLKGNFYASSGPQIYDYGIIDGEVFVECSPVDRVYFLSGNSRGYSRRNPDGDITKATYKLKGTEKYIRIECEDKYGKTAWSNPIFLNE